MRFTAVELEVFSLKAAGGAVPVVPLGVGNCFRIFVMPDKMPQKYIKNSGFI